MDKLQFLKAGGGTSLFQKSTARARILFWVFVSPALILYSIMMLYPLLRMFYVSLLDWRSLVRPGTFEGLGNYLNLFSNSDFYDALRNTAIHVGIALPLSIFPAFFIGFWLSQRNKSSMMLRIILFSPAMIAPPGKALIFFGLYFPDGIINKLLTFLGLMDWVHVWLRDPLTSLGAILAIDIWGGIGFYSVLFYAVLSNIPENLYEAAKLEGASEWNIMTRIAFPLTLNFFGISLMLHFMWLLLGATQNVLLLTKGGPGTSSLTLGYYLYEQAFEIKNLGYSQSIGVAIFIIGISGMLLIRKMTAKVYEF